METLELKAKRVLLVILGFQEYQEYRE